MPLYVFMYVLMYVCMGMYEFMYTYMELENQKWLEAQRLADYE
jgi:hypothetical protein